MLTLNKVGRSRLSYYLDQTVTAGDGSPAREAPGAFGGSVAERLGLVGLRVDERSLRTLLGGVDPATGEILDAHHGRVRVLAYDCTFAAPKSVSLVAALGPPAVAGEVRTAHREAVSAALCYLEDRAAFVCRQDHGARKSLVADGFVVTLFVHRTSRAADPHLHTHALVANLAADPDGRWSALDGRGLFEEAPTVGALFRSHLRHELASRLGVSFAHGRADFADIAGISARVVAAFSQRSRTIAAELEGSEYRSGRARRIVAHRTRPERPKQHYDALVAEWRERAQVLGLDDSRFTFAVGGGQPTKPPEPDHEASKVTDRIAGIATETLEQLEQPASRRQILRATSAVLGDGAAVSELEKGVDAALSRAIPARAFTAGLKGANGARIPPVVPEPRFVASSTAELAASVAREVSAAPTLEAHVLEGQGNVLRGVLVARSGDLLADLELVESLVGRATLDGRPVIALGPSASLTAHLEALTGARPGGTDELASERDTLVIVAGMERLAPSRQASLIALARAGRTGMVVFSGQGERGAPSEAAVPLGELHTKGTTRRAPAVSVESSAGQLRLCSGVVQVLETLLVERDRAREAGDPSACVVADRGFAALVGRDTLAPSSVASHLREVPDCRLVVLGAPSVLGRSARLPFSPPPIHVVSLGPRASEQDRRVFLARFEENERTRQSCRRSARLPRLPLDRGGISALATSQRSVGRQKGEGLSLSR